jgi:hypothetical protein
MKDFQKRVIDEKQELDAKRAKLFDFISSPAFADLSEKDRELLYRQEYLMQQYSLTLNERIERFT